MDDLLKKINYALTDGTQTDRSSDRESLYKNWGRLGNQEERRKELLSSQKGSRNDSLDQFRGLLDLTKNDVGRPVFKSQKAPYRPNIYVAGFTKAPLTYKNVLMMSEWLVEKPEDFYENWYVVPCPKGVRVLVVSNKGITKLFTKYGQYLKECQTALPGGNPGNCFRSRNFCVLDAFYVEINNTLYVLDLLAWNSQPMTNGETQFRQFWLKTHIQEIEDLCTISQRNKIIFQLLPMVSCEKNSFNDFMMKYPHFESDVPLLDGLLFYHKLANYTAGQTPLVGWLFPYMVKEVLGSDIAVNAVYEAERPPNYINQATFIEEFTIQAEKEKVQRKRSDHKSSTDSMETETIATKIEEVPVTPHELSQQ